ncbi:hypothetical protein WSM22_30250 [Cytophagales bacterium WSM2-2]|nr:hypothetical protein WSM22_30250 [Cytophagales bacterium WSM2-2]
MKTILPVVSTLALCLACATPSSNFEHDMNLTARPWTSEPKRKASDQFAFAVIGDLNGGERAGVFEVAVEQMRMLRPDLILSIGDLIDGGTEDTVQLKREFDFLDQRVVKAGAPFFHVGGNHDLTNLTMRKFWEKRYGKRYYHFVYNNVLFLAIDSEDYKDDRMQEIYTARKRAIELLDSGKTEEAHQTAYFKMKERETGEVSAEQSAYFEKVISDHPNVQWTFLFMHKPVWKREGDGNLSRIETALGSRNFTVINGHYHDYSFTQKNNRDYIMLGTTGGEQSEKSQNSFDHIMLISMNTEGPSIANLKLEGILDKTAKIPLDGDKYCYQASKCKPNK